MMPVSSEARRVPTFGILSIAAPFIGTFLFWVLIWVFTDFSLSFVLALSLIPLSPLCGLIFSAVGWFRHERYWLLRWIGLAINLGVIGWFVVNRNHIIGSLG
jgi:hypothetical protein